jgi:hypothetical protein
MIIIVYNIICATAENSLRVAKANILFDMCSVLTAQHMSSVQEINNRLFSDGCQEAHESIFDIIDLH